MPKPPCLLSGLEDGFPVLEAFVLSRGLLFKTIFRAEWCPSPSSQLM